MFVMCLMHGLHWVLVCYGHLLVKFFIRKDQVLRSRLAHELLQGGPQEVVVVLLAL
jgi:hypothetical protein